MSEFRRIFFSRRMLFTWLIGLFLCGIFFFYECGSTNQITLTGEELHSYIERYPNFLQSVKDNAENIRMLAALSGNTGYTRDNLDKTVADYSRLEGVNLIAGENKGIVLFSNFVLADAIIVAIVLVVLLQFAEEKTKGLTLLVRCTKNGRSALLLERAGILATASLTASVFVTAVCLLLSRILCGRFDFSRPLQSVPEFSLCAFPISIGEYVLLSMLLKALAAFVFGLLVLLLLVWMEAIPAVLVGGGVLFGEFLLYTLILGTDRLSGFKLANIIALLRTEIFFKNYYNINLFGNAVGFLAFSAVILVCLAIVLVVISAVASAKCTGSNLSLKFLNKIKIWCSLNAPNPPVFFWELRKVLFSQKGILILTAVLYFAASSGLEYRYFNNYDKDREVYYEKYAGVITDETIDKMQAEREEKEQLLIEANEKVLELQATDPQNPRIITLMQTCYDLGQTLKAIDEITEVASGALEYTKETGVETQLVKPDAYEKLFVHDRNTTNKNSMFLLLGIIGLFSGLLACEKECNMTLWLGTLFKGRKKLLFTKLGVIAFLTPVLVMGVSWAQLYQIETATGFNNPDATAQSLELLRQMPFPVSIGGYIAIVFVIRLLFAFLIGVLVTGISALVPNRVLCLFISFVLLVVPMVLSLTGVVSMFSAADLLGFWKYW